MKDFEKELIDYWATKHFFNAEQDRYKDYTPENYGEFYEKRWFASAQEIKNLFLFI